MASQEDSERMPSSQGTTTRRGFLGHIAGAYSAIAITGGTAVTVSIVAGLTARHRALWDAVGIAAEDMDYPSKSPPADIEDRRERYRVTRDAEEGALKELLAYKPSNLEENAERLRYLRATVWDGCMPEEWELELLFGSLAA